MSPNLALMTVLIMCLYFLLFSNAAGEWGQELSKPYIYLVPASPMKKLLWGSLTSLIKPVVDGVLVFTVVIRMLSLTGVLTGLARLLSLVFGPLGFSESWARRLLTGALEVSSGVSSLTDGSLPGRLSMAAFMLGWAGLSVHCQVLAFLGDSGLSMRTYLTGKLLHGGLSAALLGVLSPLLPLSAPVSAYLAEQTEALAALDFQRSLSISTAAAWGTWLLFFLLAARAVKNSGGKSRLHGV